MIRQLICALFLFLSLDILASEYLLQFHIRKGSPSDEMKDLQFELVNSNKIPDTIEQKIGAEIDCFCDVNSNSVFDPQGLEIPSTKRKKCKGTIVGFDVIAQTQLGIFEKISCSEGKTNQRFPIPCHKVFSEKNWDKSDNNS